MVDNADSAAISRNSFYIPATALASRIQVKKFGLAAVTTRTTSTNISIIVTAVAAVVANSTRPTYLSVLFFFFCCFITTLQLHCRSSRRYRSSSSNGKAEHGRTSSRLMAKERTNRQITLGVCVGESQRAQERTEQSSKMKRLRGKARARESSGPPVWLCRPYVIRMATVVAGLGPNGSRHDSKRADVDCARKHRRIHILLCRLNHDKPASGRSNALRSSAYKPRGPLTRNCIHRHSRLIHTQT